MNIQWKISALALLILSVSCTTYSADELKGSFEMIDFGKYSYEVIETKQNDQVVLGEELITEDNLLIEKTDQIKIEKNVLFGLRFIIVNRDKKKVPIKLHVRIPQPGIYDPEKGKNILEYTEDMIYETNIKQFDGYMLEYDDEMIPGEWIFEYIYDDKIIFKRSFNLYNE